MSWALNWEIIFLPIMFFSSLSPCWFFICGGECHKLPRYVPSKCTYVPYNGTFGASNQRSDARRVRWHPADVKQMSTLKSERYCRIRISTTILDHTDRNYRYFPSDANLVHRSLVHDMDSFWHWRCANSYFLALAMCQLQMCTRMYGIMENPTRYTYSLLVGWRSLLPLVLSL